MVIKLYHKNLYEFFKNNNNFLESYDIIIYSKSMLNSIEFLHQFNIIHRDIKPENFVFDYSEKPTQLYLLDFGLCKKITKKGKLNTILPGESVKNKQHSSFIGTVRYASINAHEGKVLSKRDDLESFLYILIYLMKSQLPWQKSKDDHSHDKRIQTQKMKKAISVNELCSQLPSGMNRMLTYVKNLSLDQNPDYSYLKLCLDDCLEEISKSQKDIFKIDKQIVRLQNLINQKQQQDKIKNQMKSIKLNSFVKTQKNIIKFQQILDGQSEQNQQSQRTNFNEKEKFLI